MESGILWAAGFGNRSHGLLPVPVDSAVHGAEKRDAAGRNGICPGDGGIYVLFLRLEGLSLRRMMGALAVFLVMCRTDRRNYGQKAFLVQTFSRCTGSPGRWRKWYTIICIILSEIQTI